jgi:uncharacterized protein DUF4202
MADGRFDLAIAAIDAANAEDPNIVDVRGTRGPKEVVHAELVTEWVRRLAPDPSDALLLAARGHHLRRWAIPRSSYPAGRPGYLRWRRAQHTQHARELGEILATAGYDGATIERVQALVTKRNLGRDAEAQTLEDALCLVFVETQFHELAARLDRDKMVDVVRKTVRKMSPQGVELAGGLPLAAGDRELLLQALAPEPG